MNNKKLAGYEPALLENWYRHNYFSNEIDISGSGVEEYTFGQIQDIAGFSFDELNDTSIKDSETVGGKNIRQQLADLFGTGKAERVMVSNGSNEALQLAIRAILQPGDEIITQNPCYHCHDKIALSIKSKVKKWSFSSAISFSDNLDELNGLITKNTRAIVLNFPHNPTGISITQEMLDRIVSIVRDRNIYLVWDAAFQQLSYDNPALIDPINSYDKTITTGTFSKAYGAPGLRFGWLIGPLEIIAACVRQKDYGNLFVSPIIEFIASKMLSNINAFLEPRIEQSSRNRRLVGNWVEGQPSDFIWTAPDGGVCGLLELPRNTDDVEFCNELLSEYRTLLVPGSCFNMPGFVRLGFGGNSSQLKEGLARLAAYIDKKYR